MVGVVNALVWYTLLPHVDLWILILGTVAWSLLWVCIFKVAFRYGRLLDLRDFFTMLNR